MNYLLGIDNGGTMTKAALFDLQGNEIAVASEKTPVIIPGEGYAQRDMTALWESVTRVIGEVIRKAAISSEKIIGIGCTGHGKGLYLWGKDDKPCGYAIASTDRRAAAIVRQWKEEGIFEEVYEKTLQYPIACQPVALLRWLKAYQPEQYANIRWVFEAKDFTRFMLTRQAFAEMTDYSGTCLLNLITGKFDKDLLRLFDIEEMYDCLPPLKVSTDLCATVSKSAAKQTGLAEGTPVCGGMFDIDACAIAMDVSDEAPLCVVTGTWSINEYLSRTPVRGEKTTLHSFFCIPGYYLIEESSPTSAGNLEYFINLLPQEEQTGKSRAELYEQINTWVRSVPAENNGLFFVPFLYGSNQENMNSAAFIGLAQYHQKEHLARAIYEGVAFSHKTHIDRLLKTRGTPSAIRLAGGVVNSDIWVQIFADVIGLPVEVIEVKELGTLGCAMAAAVCVGQYQDYKDAAEHMVKKSKTVYPNEKNKEIYALKYAKYKKLTQVLSTL